MPGGDDDQEVEDMSDEEEPEALDDVQVKDAKPLPHE